MSRVNMNMSAGMWNFCTSILGYDENFLGILCHFSFLSFKALKI